MILAGSALVFAVYAVWVVRSHRPVPPVAPAP
jgi:hypothetical protein